MAEKRMQTDVDEGPYSLWTAPLVVETSPWDIDIDELDRLLAEYEECCPPDSELRCDPFRTPVTWETLMSTAD